MRNTIGIGASVLLGLATLFPLESASAADEDVVFLRTDCSGTSSNQTCFSDLKALQSWLWSVRQPSSNSPVSVHIGPGEFPNNTGSAQAITCPDGSGHVSFIGSGPDNTKITSGGNAVSASNCTNLHFQDMSLSTTGSYAIRWFGGGSSRWVNVDVFGPWDAWLDTPPDCNGAHPIHYWFNSRLKHTGAAGSSLAGYETACGESWFYASELTYLVQNSANSTVISISGNADVRMFGSVVRAIVPEGSDPGGRNAFVVGVKAADSGSFHMHGGIISLNVGSLTKDVGVSGIENYGTGVMHTPDTAFALVPSGNGSVYRTYSQNGGPVLSPFTWPPGINPPSLVSDSLSTEGADLFVETDCDAGGDCESAQTADQEPHLMVYTHKCSSAGPWFDIVRGKCRGEP